MKYHELASCSPLIMLSLKGCRANQFQIVKSSWMGMSVKEGGVLSVGETHGLWAHYFQNEKGTAAVCSDTFD